MGTRWVTWVDGRAATVELFGQDAAGRLRAVVEEPDVVGPDGTRSSGARRELVLQLAPPRPNGQRAVGVEAHTTAGQAGVALRAAVHVGAVTGDGTRTVRVGDGRADVKVTSELEAWLGSGDEAAGAGVVTVAMPGRVVKVMARVGDAVEKGQALLIIEAMKMENEVKSRRSGTVRAVLVAEGESVEGGRTLVEVGD
jgi:biotin carboxyl carrier protein